MSRRASMRRIQAHQGKLRNPVLEPCELTSPHRLYLKSRQAFLKSLG